MLSASADLALTVRGAGRLEIVGDAWSALVPPGGERTLALEVRNTGSAALRDVRLEATAPAGWSATFEPEEIPVLAAGARTPVVLRVAAPAEASSARFFVDVSATAGEVASRTRTVSMDVEAPGGSGVVWLVGAVLAAAGGVALTVKLRRR